MVDDQTSGQDRPAPSQRTSIRGTTMSFDLDGGTPAIQSATDCRRIFDHYAGQIGG